MALFSRFLGRTASEGAAYAFGVATGPVLAPATEAIRQQAWDHYQTRIPAVGVLAEGVAQGQVDEGQAREWAHRQGYSDTAFSALIDVANVGPGSGFAFELWRRGIIDDAAFRRALKRLGIEDEWIADLTKIRDVLLSADQLANAVVQDHLTMEAATAEAEKLGYTADRFAVLVANTGLPPGPETGLAWLRRGIVSEDEFRQIILEGHTKPRYVEKYLAALHPLLTAATAVRLYLKGWYTKAERDKLGAQWGYTPDQMEDWYLSEGRPVTTRQAFIGYTRGGRVQGENWNERETFRRSVIQSNLRPEWEPILWAQRYTYPSAFVLRALTQAGDITQADAEQVLLYSGWEPGFAKQVSTAWAAPSAAGPDTHTAKAQTQLWTATHSSYINREASPTIARNKLQQAGVSASAIPTILGLWDAERELIRKGLTPANVKKAYAKGSRNSLTGQPWTRDEALAFLVNLGWNVTEANDYLDIP